MVDVINNIINIYAVMLIASKKGGSFFLWWIYGAALFIIALPHAIIKNPDNQSIERQQLSEGMKKCPYCAEMVKGEAKVCKHCGKDLPEAQPIPAKDVDFVTRK